MKNGLYSGITPKENMLKGDTLNMPPNRASKKKPYVYKRHWLRIYKDDIEEKKIIAKVGTTAWAVYCVIKSHKNWDTNTAFPSFNRIMELTGITKHKTVRKAIETLRDNGLLTYEIRKPRHPNGKEYGRKRHFYTLPKEPTTYTKT